MAMQTIEAELEALMASLRCVLDPRIELTLEIAPSCAGARCRGDTVEALVTGALRELMGALLDSGRAVLRVAPSGTGPELAVTVDAGAGCVATRLLEAALPPGSDRRLAA